MRKESSEEYRPFSTGQGIAGNEGYKYHIRILTGKLFEYARLEDREVNGRESGEREISNRRKEQW